VRGQKQGTGRKRADKSANDATLRAMKTQLQTAIFRTIAIVPENT
jgi:hypothetical protein